MQAAALVARVRSADAPRGARERRSQVRETDVHVTGMAVGGGRGAGRWRQSPEAFSLSLEPGARVDSEIPEERRDGLQQGGAERLRHD